MIEKTDLIDTAICRNTDVILEVSRILRDTARRHLIVLDENDRPVGVLSSVDIVNRVVSDEKDPSKVTAEQIMTSTIKTISLDDSYEQALIAMTEVGTYSIPVTKDKKLIGILQLQDAAKKQCIIEGKN